MAEQDGWAFDHTDLSPQDDAIKNLLHQRKTHIVDLRFPDVENEYLYFRELFFLFLFHQKLLHHFKELLQSK